MAGIMIVGTASSVGKSLMAAALCRIFKQDGLRVMPFKSQNMSLNAYVTMEGLEMGRAQVLQAQAAGEEPSVNMNPILLKPTSDRRSQVIFMGKPIETMEAQEYFKFKPRLKNMIREIYHSLEERCDLVVIEGAGSPAEINLMEDDIVNMGMAEMADAPVLLVGDIDRGGVFASIYGTLMLLEERDRKRIKGIIINKFRGDKSLLQSGLDRIEELTGVPVLGVVPYMNLRLDEEDGVAHFNRDRGNGVDVCVIKLPRMSNFTDFDAFGFDDDVKVRYVRRPQEIGSADMLILPGSKNTIKDLRWLKSQGFDSEIRDFKGIIFGICGGYQILGKEILDEEGWEEKPGEVEKGIGIFDTTTLFKGEKVTTNIEGRALGYRIYGYEIHAGKSLGSKNPFVEVTSKQGEKASYLDGELLEDRCFGSYIHGIFDSGDFRGYILNRIRKQKGLREREALDLRDMREEEINKLAKTVRDNLDMGSIYSILKGKP